MKRKPRLQNMMDVATALGLSRTTVSLCISGKASKYRISQATEKRVKDYVKSAGYVPNLMAQSINIGLQRIVGLFCNLLDTNENHHKAIRWAERRIRLLNAQCYLQYFTENNVDDLLSRIQTMIGLGVRDIIIVGMGSENARFTKWISPYLAKTRIFILDYRFNGRTRTLRNLHRIGIKRRRAYEEIFEYLYSNGHRRIAIDQPDDLKVGVFHQFLSRHSMALSEEFILSPKCLDDLYEVGAQLKDPVLALYESNNLTVVSLHDDQMAMGLIKALVESGVRVPEDISVMGFDNIRASEYACVPLTTYEIPLRAMFEKTLDAIEGKTVISSSLVIKGKTIVRSSVGQLPPDTD